MARPQRTTLEDVPTGSILVRWVKLLHYAAVEAGGRRAETDGELNPEFHGQVSRQTAKDVADLLVIDGYTGLGLFLDWHAERMDRPVSVEDIGSTVATWLDRYGTTAALWDLATVVTNCEEDYA